METSGSGKMTDYGAMTVLDLQIIPASLLAISTRIKWEYLTSSDSIVNRDFKYVSQPPTNTKSWIISRYNSKSLSNPSCLLRSSDRRKL
ncbi:hypothetical protein SPPR111872_06405 [Sphingobacterium prati]